MKKLLMVNRLLLLLLLFAIISCSPRGGDGKPVLAVTMEPYRFIVEAVAGDGWQVMSVVPKGSSPETFDPSPSTMVALGKCSTYFLTGGTGFEDMWCERIGQTFPSLPLVDTSRGIERIDHDPHLWTSPDNVAQIADNVCAAMCLLDSANSAEYRANLQSFRRMLHEVDSCVAARLSFGSDSSFIVFHPTLTYFAHRYGLRQLALEEHGKEASAAHIKEIVDEARRIGVRRVFIQAEFDKREAETVARELGASVISIDPLNYNWKDEVLHIVECLKKDE